MARRKSVQKDDPDYILKKIKELSQNKLALSTITLSGLISIYKLGVKKGLWDKLTVKSFKKLVKRWKLFRKNFLLGYKKYYIFEKIVLQPNHFLSFKFLAKSPSDPDDGNGITFYSYKKKFQPVMESGLLCLLNTNGGGNCYFHAILPSLSKDYVTEMLNNNEAGKERIAMDMKRHVARQLTINRYKLESKYENFFTPDSNDPFSIKNYDDLISKIEENGCWVNDIMKDAIDTVLQIRVSVLKRLDNGDVFFSSLDNSNNRTIKKQIIIDNYDDVHFSSMAVLLNSGETVSGEMVFLNNQTMFDYDRILAFFRVYLSNASTSLIG